jgi:hypothetical protein
MTMGWKMNIKIRLEDSAFLSESDSFPRIANENFHSNAVRGCQFPNTVTIFKRVVAAFLYIQMLRNPSAINLNLHR